MSYSAKPKIVFVGDAQPYFCEVCRYVLRDLDDVDSARDNGACTNCVLNFRYTHHDEWNSGWRPTIDEARSA